MKTLSQAVHVALHVTDSQIHRALSTLAGRPVGGWGDTRQAWAEVEAACPVRSERDWRVRDLIEAVLDGGGSHWTWRKADS